MYLSELQKKEIIDINSGKRIGIIIDVVVSQEGTVKSLIVEERKIKRFTANEERTINWQQIVKIGDDIILIDSKKYSLLMYASHTFFLCKINIYNKKKKCYNVKQKSNFIYITLNISKREGGIFNGINHA